MAPDSKAAVARRSRAAARLERLSLGLNRAVEYLLFAGGLTMALVVAVQVFCRYVLNHSLFWSEELARYLLVWITFLGASCAYRRSSHPGVDVLYVRLPAAGRKIVRLLVTAGAAFFFFILLVWGGKFAWFVRFQVSPALGLCKGLVYAVVPLSGAVMLVHAAAFLARELGGRPGPGRDGA